MSREIIYNVLDDLDDSNYDILNRHTVKHYKNYFDKKEISNTKKNYIDYRFDKPVSSYSINSSDFITRLIIILIFIIIIWDFLGIK
jgi:hypothetical protein